MAGVVTVAGAAVAVGTISAGAATNCADVDVVFARGTLELPGLGIIGGPFADAVKKALPGKDVTTFAVDYPADVAQLSAGAGADNMTDHIVKTAAECADTKFVIGGYSQGATVTDIAIGTKTVLGAGKSIPTDLASHVAAVVVFGNPQRIVGDPITQGNGIYADKAKDFCADGDPVCRSGINVIAHISYFFDGDIDKGATFAANQINNNNDSGDDDNPTPNPSQSGGIDIVGDLLGGILGNN